LCDALGPLHVLKALALAPREWRAVFQRGLLIALSVFVGFWVLALEAHPFDLLLEEAKGAARAGPPIVVFRLADTCAFEEVDHARAVNAGLTQWEVHFYVRVRDLIALAPWLIRADRHVRMHLYASFQIRRKPLFQGTELQLPRAPTGARRRQEVIVLTQP